LLIRALIAFLLLPGIVAFLLPVLWLWGTGHTRVQWPWGLLIASLGIIGLLWCVRDFFVAGKGTLAPWSPPQNLVRIGLYRYTRNPMYVCVEMILLGWSAAFLSYGLLCYSVLLFIAFYLRVVYGEEPWLARTHGQDWEGYVKRVPRWLFPL